MARPRVTVRMYKKILGDCFLLTIGEPEATREQRTHVLIDCGVLQRVPDEAKLIQAVAGDIVETTGGRLDLLVVTHEHWDHISGFTHARPALVDNMQIDNLWLAWTERRGDGQADALRDKSEKAKVVVSEAAALAATRGANVTANIENFNGPIAKNGKKLLVTDIIPSLIKRAKHTDYLEPGEILNTPGRHPLRAHVLGPPRNSGRLTKEKPSAGDAKETYLAANFERALDARYAVSASLADAMEADGPTPFAGHYAIPYEKVEKSGSSVDENAAWLRERYLDKDEAWRNVDLAWLGAAGALALKLDSDTNNTSLVLALELEPGGDVLLFAGDAQVGNWLSWHDQNYPSTVTGSAKPPVVADGPKVSARDLLSRTVLYKVGHHASHNATLHKQGLALMTHSDLVAMIPVVEAEARRKKNGKAVHRGWDMPYPELLRRLITQTSGKVLRGDAEPGSNPKGKPVPVDKAFLARVKSTGLFLEYDLP